MTTEERIQLLEITRRKGNELIDELIAFLRSGGSGCDPQFAAPPAQRDRRAPPTLDESLTGSWVEFGRSAAESYRWPDGRVENYQLFVSYRGADGFKDFTLAL